MEPLERLQTLKWYNDPVYIKMCEKAEEIQAHRATGYWEDGDFYCANIVYSSIVVCCEDGTWPLTREQGYIWLPRQDQLQDMSGRFGHCLGMLYWWQECREIDDYRGYDGNSFTSMEQLWLAFVMKELFHKVWSNGEWIESR